MKITIDVNLGGYAFIFDRDAYKLMKDYLDEIAARLPDDEKEIAVDVEQRIADILRDRMPISQQVVDISIVRKAMDTIGKPEEFGSPKPGLGALASSFKNRTPRKIYRDKSRAMIGGVCAGIAEYFNIDVTIVRLIALLILLVFGTGILVYIILWIIIPRKPLMYDYLKNKSNGQVV
ncbi:MAG: PspC domain-containing protein [Rikenellaceae bacterium]|nr:PspC domain-containing protein [Rikenellaceae bacterium]